MHELYQIYLITDKTNNKKYVGQVVQHRGYLLRFKEHLYGSKYANTKLLSNAINKHGKNMFEIKLIEDNISEHDIDEKESYYIKQFNTFYLDGCGYNMTKGGQGTHDYQFTADDKYKISISSKRFWEMLKNDPEKLQARNSKISAKLKGRKKSDLAKKHLSEAAYNRFKIHSGTFKGKKHSAESKLKIAEKNGYKVGMFDKDSDMLLQEFISTSSAAKYLVDNGVTQNISCAIRIRTICNQVQGQGKTAYGYVWKYLK